MNDTINLILFVLLLGTLGCSDANQLDTTTSQLSRSGDTKENQTENEPEHQQEKSRVSAEIEIKSPEEAIRNLQGPTAETAHQYLLENP